MNHADQTPNLPQSAGLPEIRGLGQPGAYVEAVDEAAFADSADAAPAASAAGDDGAAVTVRPDDLLNRIVQTAHDAIDRLADRAAPHLERLQGGLGGADQNLQAQAEQLRQVGDEWAESLRATVREKPLAALASAVVIGLLVDRMTRR